MHASPVQPEEWDYLVSAEDGFEAFQAFSSRLCFVGHSHRPAVWSLGSWGPEFRPGGIDVRLDAGRRYIVNVGSVGQPRDRDPRAAYAIWDVEARRIEGRRVAYDVAAVTHGRSRGRDCPGSSPIAWPRRLLSARALHRNPDVRGGGRRRGTRARPGVSELRVLRPSPGWRWPRSSSSRSWQRPAAAFGWGWLAGLLFFFTLLSWLNFTFSVYSAIPGPLVYVPTLALAAYCALYVGLFAAALAWLAGRGSPAWALLCAPFVWVAGEWVRGHLLGGFPWGLLGYSQYRELPVIQIAELGGVYAVSFVVVAANSALAALFVLRWRRALVGLVVAACSSLATLGFGAMRLAQWGAARGEVQIGIMQPSIEQPLKFDPNHAAQTLAIYLELTRRAARDRPQLLVWPETAMPGCPAPGHHAAAAADRTVGALGVPLLVGSIDVTEGRPARYRNSAFLVTETGSPIGMIRFNSFPLVSTCPCPRCSGSCAAGRSSSPISSLVSGRSSSSARPRRSVS